MKTLRYVACMCMVFLAVMGMGLTVATPADAAKELVVGAASVGNTGDETTRQRDLPITLKGGFNDVNGLAFTLVYDKDVFDFVGLVQNTAAISDDQSYQGPVASTIFYHANSANPGRVLVAAAAANFLAETTADVVPFKARFRVKAGMGSGTYPINIQRTIIGPDTGLNAGYVEPTLIPVAVGLAPQLDPSTAASHPVTLTAGSITVVGGYTISGAVEYEGGAPANGALVRLFRYVDGNLLLNAETTVNNGAFSFSNRTLGTYRIVVRATNPGFQNRYETNDFPIVGTHMAPLITLAAFAPLTGTVTVNGEILGALRVKVTLSDDTLVGYFPVDASGRFVTYGLDPGGAYKVFAVYGSQEIEITTAVNGGVPYDWDLDAGSIGGTITGLDAGQRVMVHVISGSAQVERILRLTGDGSPAVYTITNLIPAADYIVSVAGDAIPVTYFDGTTDYSAATTVTVIADVPTGDIDFSFTAPVQPITGAVFLGGAGLAGVPVFAFNTVTYDLYMAYSGSGGSYSLQTGGGDYLVFAYKSNGKMFYYKTAGESTQFEGQAVPVTAPAGTVNIHLDEATGKILGKVTLRREGGDPVPGIMVMGRGPQGNAVGVTNATGSYTLSGLYSDDSYAVTIYPGQPYAPQTRSATASDAGTNLNFVINTGWVLSGTVTISGSGGTPVPGATVYLVNSSGAIQGMPVRTGSPAGGFMMADIPGGIYTLNVEHPSYRPFSAVLQIQADTTRNVELVAGASIHGVISDNDTAPIGGALVIATTPGESARYALSQTGTGMYAIEGLTNATNYYLTVSKVGYLRQVVGPITTAGATERNVSLETPVNLWSFGGAVVNGGSGGPGIAGATVVISSDSKQFSRAAVTDGSGAFGFTNVPESTDYRIVVIPPDNRPAFIETGYSINTGIADYEAVIPAGISGGTVILNNGATGVNVQVYLLAAADGRYVADVTATDAGGGNYDFNFVGVPAGTYKIAAFAPGYTFGWYDGADNLAAATSVSEAFSGITITLTAQ